MKNLKNMLFAAAIGAVAIALPATASAADCKVEDNKITVPANGCTVSGSLTAKTIENASTTNTITFVKGSSITIDKLTDDSELVKAFVAPTAATGDSNKYAVYAKSTNKSTDNQTIYTADVKEEDAIKHFLSTAEVKINESDLGKYGKIASDTDVNGATRKNGVITIAKNTTDPVTITYTTNAVAGGDPTVTITYSPIVAKEATSSEVGYENNNKTLNKMIEEYINKNNSGAKKYASMELKGDNVGANPGIVITPAANNNKVFDDVVAKLPEGFKAYKMVDVTATFGTAATGNTAAALADIVKLPSNTTLTVSYELDEPEDLNGKAVYVYAIHTDADGKKSIDLVDTKAYFKNGKLVFNTNEFSTFAIAYGTATETPATDETKTDSKETNTGDATKEANPKTSDNVMTSVVSLLVSAFGLTAAGLKLKNN